MSTIAPLPPSEPADGIALYWPDDEESYASLLVRHDAAARGGQVVSGDPARRWFAPNTREAPMTWAEALGWMAAMDVTLDDAVRLTVAGGRESGGQPEAATR